MCRCRQSFQGQQDHLDTIHKLRLLHPHGDLDFNRDSWPSREDSRAFWADERGLEIIEQHFSVEKIRKYFQRRPALGAPDSVRRQEQRRQEQRKKAMEEQERNKAVKEALLLDPAITRLLYNKAMEDQKASEEQRLRLMQEALDRDKAVTPSGTKRSRAGQSGHVFCPHNRHKSLCKDCGGSGLCQHQREKRYCKDCDGSALCQHGRNKRLCKDCGGSGLCQHQREKRLCKDCGGSALCRHKVNKYYCKACDGGAFCKKHLCRFKKGKQCPDCALDLPARHWVHQVREPNGGVPTSQSEAETIAGLVAEGHAEDGPVVRGSENLTVPEERTRRARILDVTRGTEKRAGQDSSVRVRVCVCACVRA